MSSTNRSDARDSHIADYYITPQPPIRDFLRKFNIDENINVNNNYTILDPCAWWDDSNFMSYPSALRDIGFNNIITNDIREDSPAQYHNDFITETHINKYDIIITNPPFNIAKDIIEKSLSLCKEWWYVIMLLRLNYIWSQARQEFWTNNPPYAIYAHNKRMSFTKDNKTDSIEYAHFVWKKWYKPNSAKFYILKS